MLDDDLINIIIIIRYKPKDRGDSNGFIKRSQFGPDTSHEAHVGHLSGPDLEKVIRRGLG